MTVYAQFVGWLLNPSCTFKFECQAYENCHNDFIKNTSMNPLASSIEKIKHCMKSYQRLDITAKNIVKIWNERQNLLIV